MFMQLIQVIMRQMSEVIVAICNPTESAGKPLTEHSSETSYRACSQA